MVAVGTGVAVGVSVAVGCRVDVKVGGAVGDALGVLEGGFGVVEGSKVGLGSAKRGIQTRFVAWQAIEPSSSVSKK